MFAAEVVTDPTLDSEVIRLRHDPPGEPGLAAEVAPAFGSNLVAFTAGEHHLIDARRSLLAAGEWTGCFVLWPLPNRVRDKAYLFEGRRHSLEGIRRARGNDVLIHGLVDDRPWTFLGASADRHRAVAATSIAITPETEMFRYFPFPSRLTLRYTLSTAGLEVGYTVENLGEGNLPFGFALHPYFSDLGERNDMLITVPAEYEMASDSELLPTGELLPVARTGHDLRRARRVSDLHLDHVFTGLSPGAPSTLEFRNKPVKLSLRASPEFTHVVVFTREAGSICVENQTGSTDMINLHARAVAERDRALEQAAHLLILPPGGTHVGWIRYEVDRTDSRGRRLASRT